MPPPSLCVPRRLLLAALLAVASLQAASATRACRLPVPDGGEQRPSPHNLQGEIAAVNGRSTSIRQEKTNRTVEVEVDPGDSIYTAFGGNATVSELTKGQVVWVWYKDCKQPLTGKPVSAYFRIYSTEPKDRPK
jgi:hypothetical protein